MVDKINLSVAVRSNLLTLQRTAGLTDITQERLATGLKVNSAQDDATAFFIARSLNFRADDLSRIKDNIELGISTVTAGLQGIEAITELMGTAKGLANNAAATGDTNERSTLAVQFNDILTQLDDLTNDASFNGINLIKGTPDNLVIDFNEDSSNTITVSGLDSTTASTGLNVANATNDFADSAAIDTALTAINSALVELRGNAATLGSNNSILRTRLSFTEDLANTLLEGSGTLTLADLNEEGANLLSLQTRQQLGLNSLALASQSERAVLALFG